LSEVTLGGARQWLLIRGQNLENPILLFVHGGPGTSELPLLRKYNGELEKHYTIVTWDQRGAGKSNYLETPDSTLNTKQILEDTHELVAYLKKRFNQEKIFICGHSWGTILALETVNKYPEDFYAYIGVGQVVDMKMNLVASYDSILVLAEKKGLSKDVSNLAQIDLSRRGLRKANFDDAVFLRNWIARNGRIFYGKNGYFELGVFMVFAREYNIWDKVKFTWGMYRSRMMMWDEELFNTSFLADKYEFQVPVYFFSGVHDFLTCHAITESFYETVKAPYKELFVFENSAHCPIFEEADRFNSLMINEVKKQMFNNRILSK